MRPRPDGGRGGAGGLFFPKKDFPQSKNYDFVFPFARDNFLDTITYFRPPQV